MSGLESKCEAYKEDKIYKKINEYIEAYTGLGYFSGSVLIARKGRALLRNGYGMANIEHNVPNTPDTKYRIASGTKIFTAVAAIMLEQKGLLKVCDPIGLYISGFPNGDKITVHHLLTHTSGIPNFAFDPEFQASAKLHNPVEKIIEGFRDKPLEFEPGDKYSYSNSGYILLACIIEEVSGKSYESFLYENIFTKLKMLNTGFVHHETILKDMASGYSMDAKGIINAEYYDTTMLAGWAGMYSTVEDLYIFDRALYRDELVSREMLDKLYAVYVDCGDSSGYGYGWFLKKGLAYHGGLLYGFCSYFGRYYEKDMSVIILSNNDLASLNNIVKDVESILLGRKHQLPDKKVEIEYEKEKYDDFTGKYETKEKYTIEILREGEALFIGYCEVIIHLRLELYPCYEGQDFTSFFAKTVDLKINFKRDKKGKVKKAIVFRQNYKFEYKKVNVKVGEISDA